MVYRIYVEKRPGLTAEADALAGDIRTLLGISSLKGLRLLNRYDVENISPELFDHSVRTILSEPQLDLVTDTLPEGGILFAVEYLPGQFDQRADSAAQCIQILSQGERPLVRSARVYHLTGDLTAEEVAAIKKYLINPVESREASLEPFDTLKLEVAVAAIQVKEGDSWQLRLVNEGLNLRDTAPYQLNYSQTDGTLSIWSSPDHFNLLPSHSDSDIRVELTVPSGTVLDRAELTLGVGSLDWQDCAVEGLLQAENGVGKLDVSAPVGETELTTGVGDVSLEVMGEQADYAWQLDAGVGDIRLNGETTPPFTFTETGGQGKYTLSLSAGTGSVSLDFQ